MIRLRKELKFHEITDIRKVYDIDPASSRWEVYYTEVEGCDEISTPLLDLTLDSQHKVLTAFLPSLIIEDEGSDNTMLGQLTQSGYGSDGIM